MAITTDCSITALVSPFQKLSIDPPPKTNLTNLAIEVQTLITDFLVDNSTYLRDRRLHFFSLNRQWQNVEINFLAGNNSAVSAMLRDVFGAIDLLPLSIQNKLRAIGGTITALTLEGLVLTDRALKDIVNFFPQLRSINLANAKVSPLGLRYIASLEQLVELNLDYAFQITDDHLAELRKTHLHLLSLADAVNITERGLGSIIQIQSLQHLDLTNCNGIESRALSAALPFLSGLQSISIAALEINNECLQSLTKLSDLQEIVLNSCTGFTELPIFPRVQSLNLQGCRQIQDAHLQIIAQMTTLHELFLSYCSDITDNGLSTLSSLKLLETLDVNGCVEISDKGLSVLLLQNAFTHLFLEDTAITHETLCLIGKHIHLRSLSIARCIGITGSALQHIVPCRDLQSIKLDELKQVDAESLQLLMHFQELQHLSIEGCKSLNDEVCKYIGKIPRLRILSLYGIRKITDRGLFYLQNLRYLEELDISYCSVSNAGMQYVAKMQSLQLFTSRHCWRVTEDGLEQLATLRKIEMLEVLMQKGFSEYGVWLLRNCHNITSIKLSSGSCVSAQGVRHLRKLHFLQCLDLKNLFLTDEAAKILAQLPLLRELYLSNVALKNTTKEILYNIVNNPFSNLRMLVLNGEILIADGKLLVNR